MKIVQNIKIKAPSNLVFDYISNFENNPLWQGGMVKCDIVDNQPLSIGQEYIQVAKFRGKDIESRFKVIEYIPNVLVKATTIESTFPITFTRIVKGDDHLSHVTAIVEGDASGIFKLMSPLMKLMVKLSIRKDYKKLKTILESNKILN